MAKSGNNIVTHGLSGKVGDLLVFRQRNGETIVASKPDRHAPMSEAQLNQIQHFQEAVLYSKGVLSDPAMKEAYAKAAKKGQSAYVVALADFLKAPHIDEIDVTGYTGQPGSSIRVRAVDNFKVSGVGVRIENSDGKLIENGNAVCGENGLDWIFTASASNDLVAGDKIIITVTDLPGHNVVSEKVI